MQSQIQSQQNPQNPFDSGNVRLLSIVGRMRTLSQTALSSLEAMRSCESQAGKARARSRFSSSSSELSARMDTLSAFVGQEELESFAAKLGGKWDARKRRLLFPDFRRTS